MIQSKSNYSLSSNSLIFSAPLEEGSFIEVITYKGPTGLEGLGTESVEGEQGAALLKRDIDRCLEELRDLEREIVALKGRGFSHQEISEFTDTSEANVRVILHRSRKQLHICLEGRAE